MRAGLRTHLQHAAVDYPGGSGDVTSLWAGEEGNHRSDLAGVADGAEVIAVGAPNTGPGDGDTPDPNWTWED